jgi:hypothetical protein
MPRRASLYALAAAVLMFCVVVGTLTVRELWSVLRSQNDPVIESIFGRPRRLVVPQAGEGRQRLSADPGRMPERAGARDA